MLHYLYANELNSKPILKNAMFKDRAVQFSERLGWDVRVDAYGEERDEYDDLNPLYVIWEMADGRHGGSMRALPTTGPCMTNDHFNDVAGGDIKSPLIWESTRFCLSPNADDQIGRVSAAIMLAGCEIGLKFGLKHAVGVFDARMVRIYRALGWSPEILGTSGEGRMRVSVGLWEFSERTRLTLCHKAEIAPELSALWIDRAFGMPRATELKSKVG
jgi:acyl homoserine lactone synthase